MDLRSLSVPNRWLINQCQCINFGSVMFFVRGGEPDTSRPHCTVRTLRLAGGGNGSRPESGSASFELRREHIELFAQLKRLPDGTRVRIKLTHGMPGNSIDIEEEHQAA